MRHYDAQNRRLVYLTGTARPDDWDERWSRSALEKLLTPGRNAWLTAETRRYLPAGAVVLEGGCGCADKVYSLKAAGYRAVGFDTVQKTVNRALEVCPELNIAVGDIRNLPLHADVSYSSYKIFPYLNDVTIANGPFVYCPGTHKLTLKRLILECILSVAYCLTNKRPPHVPQPHRLTHWIVRKLGIDIVPVVGRANSMVLANVMEFHGRQRFDSIVRRRALFLNFRYPDARTFY